uniref:Uncharacterized protein n=1 Tax=Kalanchoe fedtschenkoi TaxID=63787 RepID=A0A7N0V9V5_KALFE
MLFFGTHNTDNPCQLGIQQWVIQKEEKCTGSSIKESNEEKILRKVLVSPAAVSCG